MVMVGGLKIMRDREKSTSHFESRGHVSWCEADSCLNVVVFKIGIAGFDG